jgi:hypothetical protein
MFLSPYGQASHLQGMANQSMSAMQRENDSRVDQMREAAGQSHEMAMQGQRLNAGLAAQRMDLQKQREKYGVLSGLVGKATGTGGFRIDGRGNYSSI